MPLDLNGIEVRLWPNQVRALQMCSGYLDREESGALVHMPTGTGKTGVIAVLASLLARKAAVLVASPSRGLANQLKDDISGKFWSTIGVGDDWKPERVVDVFRSKSSAIRRAIRDDLGRRRLVFVGTLQALNDIRVKSQDLYRELSNAVGTIIVDEGHREPAPEWAATIREMGSPTILFSATPFRNDFKRFNISSNDIFYLSFLDSVAQKLIRDVEFTSCDSNFSVKQFATYLVEFYDDALSLGRISQDAKVILRFEDKRSIERAYNAIRVALADRDEGVLAVHDQFSPKGISKLKNVPDIRTRSEKFLIHQYKLMEGIDEPRCCILGIYHDFGNERQLVQQVGRIIRHPHPLTKPANPALVVTRPNSKSPKMWASYQKFDEICRALGSAPIRNDEEVIADILALLPKVEYSGKKFRALVDLDDNDTIDDATVNPSVIIYKAGGSFQFDQFVADLRSMLTADDRFIMFSSSIGEEGEVATHAFLSSKYVVSEILETKCFPEIKLTVTATFQDGDLLFFHDSEGLYIDEIKELAGRLSQKELACLLPKEDGARVTMLTAANTDIGPSSLRTRTLTAASLSEAAPFLGDFANVLSRVAGKRADGPRRYLGFTRGRVTDESIRRISLAQFVEWCSELATEIRANPDPVALFDRFAQRLKVVPELEPQNILIDISELEKSFQHETTNDTLNVSDYCADIRLCGGDNPSTHTYEFDLDVESNGVIRQHRVLLRFDTKRQIFRLESNSLSEYETIGTTKRDLVTHLEKEQAFRIVFSNPNIAYVRGGFYAIDIGQESLTGLMMDIVHAVPDLDSITSEKGSGNGEYSNWSSRSLFRLLDQELKAGGSPSAFGPRFEGVVCEDLGSTEAADFICFDQQREVVCFIQAKCVRGGANLSATSLQDVTSQLTKNLHHLRFGASDLPGSPQKWNGKWKNSPTYKVSRRIRCGPTTAAEFRTSLRKLLRRPNTRREAWVVISGAISRQALKHELENPGQNPQLLQVFNLIVSLYTQAKSLGIDPKVFCNP